MRFEPGQLIGRYRIEGVIAWGGFAVVYRAYDTSLEHDVAIKVLADNYAFDAEARSRFSAEARSMRMLDNPAVVTIFDIGETEQGQPYLVMNLADRGTLADRLTGDDPVQSDEFARVARFLVEALGAMHDARLIHRDVKPSNILIRAGDDSIPAAGSLFQPGDHLLLADLGLVKDLTEGSGFTAQAGSVGYASPEQQSKLSKVDERSDIFAASAVLAQLLIGRLPDEGETWAELLEGSEHPRLAAALLRGLSDQPADRPDSIDDWAHEIGAGIEAWSNPSPWWVRRWLPAAVGLAAITLLGLIVFAVGDDRRADDGSTADAAIESTPGTTVLTTNTSISEAVPDDEVIEVSSVDPPADVKVVEVEGDSVTVEWAPLGDDQAGVNLTVATPDVVEKGYFDTTPNESTSYTFYRLTPDVDHKLSLVAIGVDGSYSAEVVIEARTGTGSAIDDAQPGTQLRSFRSDLCITLRSNGLLEQDVCLEGEAPSQRFEVADAANTGFWSLRHQTSGSCVTVGGVLAPGSSVYLTTLADCLSTSAQEFRFADKTGVHELRFRVSEADDADEELCLDVLSGNEDSGTPIVAFSCNKARNQRWIVERPSTP